MSVREEKQATATNGGITGVARTPPASAAVIRPIRAPLLHARLEVIEGTSSEPRTIEYFALEFYVSVVVGGAELCRDDKGISRKKETEESRSSCLQVHILCDLVRGTLTL